jgi:hypothetical protein
MHAVRLGYQGIELMETRNITLPMEGEALQACQEIRAGKWNKQQALSLMYSLEDRLQTHIDASNLPEQGDRDGMSKLLHTAYQRAWAFEDLMGFSKEFYDA